MKLPAHFDIAPCKSDQQEVPNVSFRIVVRCQLLALLAISWTALISNPRPDRSASGLEITARVSVAFAKNMRRADSARPERLHHSGCPAGTGLKLEPQPTTCGIPARMQKGWVGGPCADIIRGLFCRSSGRRRHGVRTCFLRGGPRGFSRVETQTARRRLAQRPRRPRHKLRRLVDAVLPGLAARKRHPFLAVWRQGRSSGGATCSRQRADGCDGVTAYESEILKLEYAQMADPIVGRVCTLQRDAKRIGKHQPRDFSR